MSWSLVIHSFFLSLSFIDSFPLPPFLLLLFFPFLGQSGLGKSTLVNTIFASHLIESKGRIETSETTRQTTEIESVAHSKENKINRKTRCLMIMIL
jgi:septin family protein